MNKPDTLPISEFVRDWLSCHSSDFVMVRRIYVEICDRNLHTGTLLSQIMYWHGFNHETGKPRLQIHREGHLWLAKSAKDWWDECCICERTAVKCLAHLRELGLIETRVWKFAGTPTTHIRIVWSALENAIQRRLQPNQHIPDQAADRHPKTANSGNEFDMGGKVDFTSGVKSDFTSGVKSITKITNTKNTNNTYSPPICPPTPKTKDQDQDQDQDRNYLRKGESTENQAEDHDQQRQDQEPLKTKDCSGVLDQTQDLFIPYYPLLPPPPPQVPQSPPSPTVKNAPDRPVFAPLTPFGSAEGRDIADPPTKTVSRGKKRGSGKGQDKQELYRPFLEVWNECAPSRWTRHRLIPPRAVKFLDKWTAQYGERSLEVWQCSLERCNAEKFTREVADWTMDQYCSNDKPYQYWEKYQQMGRHTPEVAQAIANMQKVVDEDLLGDVFE